MPTILIADDDEIIRATLEALLEQYKEEHQHTFTILHAKNGKEALDICSQNHIDLIFLDVMMPEMDGSQAAKQIKKITPKTMIVAISSVSDENKQNEMINHGAEDYITKPIVSALFLHRLSNYLRIIQSRDSIGFKHNAVNTFTSTIYNYKIEFNITTYEELTQFWETLLMRYEMQRLSHDINEAVSFIYRLGSLYLEKKFSFNLFLEEDKEFYYLSMNNLKLLPHETIEKQVYNYYKKALFSIKDNIISFLVNKVPDELIPLEETNELPIEETKKAEKVDESKKTLPASVNPPAATPAASLPKKITELHIFHFLDPDDLDDLDDNLDKLHHIISRMNSHNITAEDCQNIAYYFQTIAQAISLSNETYTLSSSLQQLAASMTSYQELFIQQSKNLSEFVLAFVNDLIQWKNMVFYDGAPSINFMDASIVANVQMITVLLVPQEQQDNESLDDIFDF